ncbi:SDR family NAD(P)-dependent oxidoreductase [Streptomyces sp. SID3343]|uniref:SDR family NAD(P)-dependent oxidoreductase n=1 Tax=Streptomyces sp. SID3343 TaxID=2690260 RepID=UPI00136B8B37|nr:SDR family NAD(P)-dependent oxidoreductase [Streptomyces sp. SID3343]MYW03785.1 SDR family NAD(P)-dependent oxidoreductase [Streptomyces sp. SID3343]
MTGLDGAVIAVAGAGGPTGRAVVARLARAGAQVYGADADAQRLRDSVDAAPGARGAVVDLLDADATRRWAAQVEHEHGRVDGLVHLVGGWRGGKKFGDNSLDDWALLHDLLVRTVQHTSLAFHDSLARSPRGRFALVSAAAAAKPAAGNAGYAAAKAAAETWTLALADSFAETDAAAVILVVKALVDDAMREARPNAKFAGFTDVGDLADEIAGLWNLTATDLNGKRLCLNVP